MSREGDWMVGNLRRLAKQQQARKKPSKRGKRLRPTEQMQRFLGGEEYQRVEDGSITPTQYQRYQVEMLKRLGVEV